MALTMASGVLLTVSVADCVPVSVIAEDTRSIALLHAGWRGLDGLSVVLGIDNVFDRTYAEHLSRAGSSVPGYPTTARVNEPGRQFWLRANWALTHD